MSDIADEEKWKHAKEKLENLENLARKSNNQFLCGYIVGLLFRVNSGERDQDLYDNIVALRSSP